MRSQAFHVSSLLCCLALSAPMVAFAEIGAALTLQGLLTNAAGVGAPDGDYPVTFRFYAGADDAQGEALTVYVHPNVAVKGGVFSASLGADLPFDTSPIGSGQAAWLGVQVAADAELPRVPLHPVPYAIRSLFAASAASADTAGSAGALSCSGCIGADHLSPLVLAVYVKTSALADYVKTSALADYVKTGALADYAKKSELAPVATAGTYASLTGTPPSSAADGMTPAGVSNLQAGKLYDGSSPWSTASGTLVTDVKTSASSNGSGQTHNCSPGFKLVACTCSYENETTQFWPGVCKIKSPTQCYGRG